LLTLIQIPELIPHGLLIECELMMKPLVQAGPPLFTALLVSNLLALLFSKEAQVII
jgi:hypothetical protein